MWTIGKVCHRFGISRSTLLYYDRIGLLKPSGRGGNGYRLYGEGDRARMGRICSLREAGLSLKVIGQVLADEVSHTQAALEQRLSRINREIGELRSQQSLIIKLLQVPKESLDTGRFMNKDQWVAILDAAGIDDEGKREWHVAFERLSPEGHQDFLESLGIGAEEIKSIRQLSQPEQKKR